MNLSTSAGNSFWASLAQHAALVAATLAAVTVAPPVGAPRSGDVVTVAGRTGIVAFYLEQGGRRFGYVVFDLYQGSLFLPDSLTAIG